MASALIRGLVSGCAPQKMSMNRVAGVCLMFVLWCSSCSEMPNRDQAGDVEEIEFVRPVKEKQPEESPDFTEESNGTPIEGKQSAPKDELLHESTPEEDALWY